MGEVEETEIKEQKEGEVIQKKESICNQQITLKQFLIGILVLFFGFCLYSGVEPPTPPPTPAPTPAPSSVVKKTLISTDMATTIIKNTEEFEELKFSHQLMCIAKNSIELKNEESYKVSVIETIKRTDTALDKFHSHALKAIKEDLHYDEIPRDLKNKINRQIDRAKDNEAEDFSDQWIEAYLTGDYGGTSRVGFALIGFKVDPENKDNIIMGISGYREEWVEQDGVRPIAGRWKKDDLKKYIKYKLYKDMYTDMDVNVRNRINSKTDLDSPIKSAVIDGIYVELNGNMLGCQARTSNIVFISDKSGSMYSNDGGKSTPKGHQFILDKSYLLNRLGCLYSATNEFIKVRTENKCNDIISTVLFDNTASIVSNREDITVDFVEKFLIQHQPGGGTDFFNAFEKAKQLIRYDEKTTVIFLTDGEAPDNGVSNIVAEWSKKMGDLLSFYCMVLGDAGANAVAVVEQICKSGNGEMKTFLDGEEMAEGYQDIAWKETR
mmetsp:Transcript_65661/g.80374  ORF Transcript_65661/g.80374 Transcript_65661/m.80374 type:complete len:494 (-) Transcript_65661:24-1505(-)